MLKSLLFTAILCAANAWPLQTATASVVKGQIDDFESGTTLNWANGGAPQPLNITTGGPAGANDNFLKVTADGSGSVGKLTVFNRSQWLGNYLGQGINEIDMDLENLGSTPLTIRLAFKSTTSNGAPSYLSAGFALPADAIWHHAAFQITPGSMIAVSGPTAFSTFFTSEAEMRIINEAGAANSNGDVVVSQLGIDNITALPEPSSLILAASGGLAWLLLVLRYRRSVRLIRT